MKTHFPEVARRYIQPLSFAAILVVLLQPLASSAQHGSSVNQIHSDLRRALAFHASFDGQVDADFAVGDPAIYTAPSWDGVDEGQPGLPGSSLIERLEGDGRHGDAVRIDKEAEPLIYFKADENMAYREENWSGTVSFWLRLDPDRDLAPGYSDPLLITPRSWNDASLFVDFTRDENPRRFRFAAFADFDVWNESGQEWSEIPPGERPMVEVRTLPFARDKWTHVVMTFSNFNTGTADGVLRCYLDGTYYGAISNREQTYTWAPEEALISLGIDYRGGFDELSVFNRALSEREVKALYGLKGGVKSLLPTK